jgi:hypothetical protein
MFRISSENNVAAEMTLSIPLLKVIPKSQKFIGYKIVMNYLRTLYSVLNIPLLAYEVKLNRLHDKYPDFFLLLQGKEIRIEVKDKESEQTIAKEINSLDMFNCKEFWYVICGNSNIDKILAYATKKDERIKIFHQNELRNNIKRLQLS